MADLRVREMQCRAVIAAAVLSVTCMLVSGCGSGGSDGGSGPSASSAAGTVTGQVISLANNAPVSGAAVKTEAGTTTTAADGKFSVPAPAGDRTIVHVEAAGFAEAFPVVRVLSGQTANLGVKLVPVGATDSVSVTTGGAVSVPNSTARVTIPANGLVQKSGGTPARSVNVSVTPINPAADTNVMPGGFNGISAGGGTVQPIESFGVLLVDIRDDAGTRYNLAQGRTATIRIPVGTQSANPPATVPLWSFDDTAGVWQEEGTATLQGTAANRYYEGAVSRISYWNADLVFDSIVVTGCVKDANGQPVANAIVRAEGIDYTGVAFDSTAADGTFTVAMRKNSRAKLGLFEFDPQTFNSVPSSNTVNVGPSATDISRSNCLVKQPGPVALTTAALVGGTVGVAYNQTLAASGGVPGYVWSLNAGSNPLPAGLSLNPSGVISGTPTAASTTTVIVKVTDSAGGTATKELSLTMNPTGAQPLSITTTALPPGTVGTAYNATLAATGGTGTKSWSVSSGTLSAGLTLNASTGVISGMPPEPGVATVTIRVQDRGTPQQSAERQLVIAILPSGGGGGGQLTVSNAPASVGGTFVADPQLTNGASSIGPTGLRQDAVGWGETNNIGQALETASVIRVEQTLSAVFGFFEDGGRGATVWGCGEVFPGLGSCPGLTFNKAAGSATFSNVALTDPSKRSPPITLNGTLTFTPF